MEVSKVREIVLDWIGVDSILSDPAASEIYYFKHDLGAPLTLILIWQP